MRHPSFTIRPAHPGELAAAGRLVADAYAALPGMPGADEQPAYYRRLRAAARRARHPAIDVLVAVEAAGDLLGCVDYIDDLSAYGAGGAIAIPDAAGIRLLAVAPAQRGRGVGRTLTEHCIARARARGRTSVVLHTTAVMRVAWGLYERLGFTRLPDLDFAQGALQVYGFRLQCRPMTRGSGTAGMNEQSSRDMHWSTGSSVPPVAR